ncbi:hypothetical protein [Skermania piniformis]|uniref:DUF948 domain-containing protein n=1 Tax=Skermania pinensis TaxID=39122 RepID=A0ABX8S886_9ACTN|nr:hypothetical protein [Skermania piniformis]QXQ13978.1 hypothetical protein KV203_00440 [Skermania piniformis]
MSIAEPVLLIGLVVALIGLVAAPLIGLRLRRARAQQWTAELDLARTRALGSEHRRVARAADDVADVTQATTETVVVTTGVVETAHFAIAAIPFSVLEAIPVTRRPSRIARRVHDEVAGAVYRTIQGTSRSVGGAAGRRRPAPQRPPADSPPELQPGRTPPEL